MAWLVHCLCHGVEEVAAETVVDETGVPGGQLVLDPRFSLFVADIVGPCRQAGRDRVRTVGDRLTEIGGEVQWHGNMTWGRVSLSD